MFPNDVKLRINAIDQLDTYLFMKKNKAISAVANTIKKFHTQKNMHLINKKDFFKYKQKEIDELFIEYLVPIMGYIDHPALIEEWKQNHDPAAYEKKSEVICKDTIN